ncbi:response regulator [Paenibacillus glycanilyticus]|uniref:response regulator n=1 Tax=Paenibacillus glycanilyticus TaxID=126569 RepID=UPI000FD94367|nr:response regulator [Paenibacillus glycanilyticus]
MKTLIVDDEHFVRKGLILTVPWKEYGFDIVGEAENGQKALEQLAAQPIEVLITDLTMPKMSGFELMKEVQQQYPHIWIVVLTCHQDFGYVVDAMHAGAIDYLVKTQIEEGKMEEALARIEKRISDGTRHRQQAVVHKSSCPELIVVPARAHAKLDMVPWPASPTIMPIEQGCFRIADYGIYDVKPLHKFWEEEQLYESWIPVVYETAPEKEFMSTKDWVAQVKESVFYRFRRDLPSPLRFIPAVSRPAKGMEPLEKIDRMFHSMHWIFDMGLYQTWIQLVEEAEPNSSYMSDVVGKFLKALSVIQGSPTELVENRSMLKQWDWHELLQSLTELRLFLQQRNFPEETAIGIYKAILLIHDELSENLNQENVAQRVALSRSYFGQCFRPIVGMSFHELLTEMRIRKAEELLVTSNEYIYSVAEQSGFQDEKYFSKVFKQHRNLLPKEYREKYRK